MSVIDLLKISSILDYLLIELFIYDAITLQVVIFVVMKISDGNGKQNLLTFRKRKKSIQTLA